MIRLATPDDAAEVARLLAAFRTWYGSSDPDDASFERSVQRLLVDPQTEYLLGGDPPAAVAQLRFRWSVWAEAEDCWLEDLYVEEAARGTGLGRAMVEAAMERARARGCRRIELDVDDANHPARALYEALGFAEKNGGAAYMQRRL